MTIVVKASAISILICLLLLVTLLSIAAYPIFAQDATKAGTRRDAVKQKVETRRENVDARVTALREKMASREAVLKAKLETFKDKRKAEITQRVSTNLNKINENHTQMMLKFLTRASEILTKLENRVNQGTSDIKDKAAAKAAIADAKVAIDAAMQAVNSQASNDYTITVSSESRVKADAQNQRKKLHDDLGATRQLVGDAKKAVSNAIRVAKSGSLPKEATPSGQ